MRSLKRALLRFATLFAAHSRLRHVIREVEVASSERTKTKMSGRVFRKRAPS
jgi:uncharacterized protein YdcH (DUF465 family)